TTAKARAHREHREYGDQFVVIDAAENGAAGEGAAAQQRPGAWPTAASSASSDASGATGGAGRRPGGWPTAGTPGQGGGPAQAPAAPAPSGPAPSSAPTPSGGSVAPSAAQGAVQVRQMWPDILEAVKNRRRFTWILLSQNAQVAGFDGTTLQLAFSNAGARDSFVSGGSEDVLRQALSESLGLQWRVEAIVDPSGGGGSQGGGSAGPGQGPGPGFGGGGGAPRPAAPAPAPQQPVRPAAPAPEAASPPAAPAPDPRPRPEAGAYGTPERPPVSLEDDLPEADDPDLDESALSGHDLIVRELGATVVEEFSHE
ncbi:DNA polymerase III subunit gamma and tau, partial [Streptomyces sp. NPDC002055]